MGAFFTMIGIGRVPHKNVVAAFQQFESSDGTHVELFACDSGAVTVLVGDVLYDSQEIVSRLTKTLGVPALLLSYSDDVVWGYELLWDGKIVDRYSSRPTYWALPEGLSESDLAGSPSTVARIWGNVEESSISRYLTNKQTMAEDKSAEKAYPDDRYEQWDAWQMCDFMNQLGLIYPVDEEGHTIAGTIASLTISTENGRAQMVVAEAKMAELLAKFRAMQNAQ